MAVLIDLTGERFGKLTVVSRAPAQKPGAYWYCRCDCGSVVTVSGVNLRKSATKSCGCLGRGRRAIDLTGRRYGKLTVIRRVPNPVPGTAWYCRCDCGSTVVVAGKNLRTGNTKSCGCLRRN